MQSTLHDMSHTHEIRSEEAIFRQVFNDCHVPGNRAETASEVAEYESAALADLIDELMDFKAITIDEIRDIERRSMTDLGPQRFAHVKAVLLRAWQSDRMI
jgi:hypothetical protein